MSSSPFEQPKSLRQEQKQESGQLPELGSSPNYGLDFNARLYAKVTQYVQVPSAIELLTRHEFKGNERVLDSGCGDGFVTKELLYKQRVPRGKVVGVDVNAGMVQWAKHNHLQGQDYERLTFVQGDVRELGKVVESLGLEPQSFDLVFSNYAHHWMFTQDDKDRAYSSIHSVLVDGGVLLDRLLREGSFQELIDPALEVARSNRWKKYFTDGPIIPRMPAPDPIIEALDKANFSQVNISQLETVRKFNSRSNLTHWFAACFRTFMTPIEEKLAGRRFEKRKEQLLFSRDVISEFWSTDDKSTPGVTENLTQVIAQR